VVNEYDEANLKRVFLDYGDLKNACIGENNCRVSENSNHYTTDELKEVP
jgi:16S rRNA (cytosine1402-N4)-methyltransferase